MRYACATEPDKGQDPEYGQDLHVIAMLTSFMLVTCAQLWNLPARSIIIKVKTTYLTSSTGAELAALRVAVELISQGNRQERSVFTDSEAALQRLQAALRRGSYELLVLEIREAYHGAITKGHNTLFQWLPGRCDIAKKHCADEAAKSAHTDGPYDYSCVKGLCSG